MKILSMTATFGKLANDTLRLEPGMNVINRPNEWGKSTWCAFLVAMLYGIDTKERTTTAALADKEHYAPWSGAPMSGRMEILWNGKAITLERTTKGRVPMGEFRAYETESGLPVAELTASNCGEMLLGVEKSVFTRSAFVRLSDMPVTQDEALRRRLNALVTTGDESGTGDLLAQKLKDLRNKCRHNKTGLLPQAEAQRDMLKNKLDQHASLQVQLERIQVRKAEAETQLAALRNHEQALEYARAQEGLTRLENAKQEQARAQAQYEQAAARCQMLPDAPFAAQQLQQLQQLKLRKADLDAEVAPAMPQAPEAPALFAGMTAQAAVQKATADKAAYDRLAKPVSPLLGILAAILAAAGIGLYFVKWFLVIPAIVAAAVCIALQVAKASAHTRDLAAAKESYGDLQPEEWVATARAYQDKTIAYQTELAAAQGVAAAMENRKQTLHNSIYVLTQGISLEEATEKWTKVLEEHQTAANAKIAFDRANQRVKDLSAAIKPVEKPAQADSLILDAGQTMQAIARCTAELQNLQHQAGQCAGQKETLGAESALEQQLSSINARIAQLEDTYSALTIAMETLTQTDNELQRRFAPRIAQRAQEIFCRMTGGRYDRLQLTQDLSVDAATTEETALQAARWRSDGTVDQLYLALRLAVSAELIPDAPLVLDDALVRFDETRLARAMEILKEASGEKQVILFTCQNRETA